jgi:hypothetical protein
VSRPGGGIEWTPAGIAVVILALFLGGGWATGLVMAASSRTPPITDTTSDLLLAVGGVLAGSVSTYIGGVLALKRHAHDDEPGGDP